jgi:hypothetical protein
MIDSPSFVAWETKWVTKPLSRRRPWVREDLIMPPTPRVGSTDDHQVAASSFNGLRLTVGREGDHVWAQSCSSFRLYSVLWSA